MKINCRFCSMSGPANPAGRPRSWSTVPLSTAVIAVVAAGGIGGCASFGAKPWERDLMAEQAMQLDPYPLESAIDNHIYFSKEASSGGRSFAGGGCGCN